MASSDIERKNTLLDLPAEIFNQITEYVVTAPAWIDLNLTIASMNLSTMPPTNTWKLTPQIPPLALTCKSLHADVSSIYFASNTFLWHCKIDDYDNRDYPLEQLDMLNKHLGSHARHLQHFYFTLEYIVQYQHNVRRARYQMRSHRDKDGKIECERWFAGVSSGGTFLSDLALRSCSCDLVGKCGEAEEKGLNLLAFADMLFRGEPYRAEFGKCEKCGLEGIEPY